MINRFHLILNLTGVCICGRGCNNLKKHFFIGRWDYNSGGGGGAYKHEGLHPREWFRFAYQDSYHGSN